MAHTAPQDAAQLDPTEASWVCALARMRARAALPSGLDPVASQFAHRTQASSAAQGAAGRCGAPGRYGLSQLSPWPSQAIDAASSSATPVSAVVDRFGCRQACRTDFSAGYPRLISAPRIPSAFAAMERCRVISRTVASAWRGASMQALTGSFP